LSSFVRLVGVVLGRGRKERSFNHLAWFGFGLSLAWLKFHLSSRIIWSELFFYLLNRFDPIDFRLILHLNLLRWILQFNCWISWVQLLLDFWKG
jgi:hypothetical protein